MNRIETALLEVSKFVFLDIVQANNISGEGTSASEELEELVVDIVEALTGGNNPKFSFGLNKTRLIGVETDYSYTLMDGDESGDLFFPQAEITLIVEVR